MRTIFEDTTLKADMEEARSRGDERKSTLPGLWLIAILFLGGVWGAYRWADSRPAVTPPPPPVSLEDDNQTSRAFSNFNQAVRDGKWPEAETMLSTAAKQRLADEQKSLAESLLGKFKDYKIFEAGMTPSVEKSDGMMRRDCLYKFIKDDFETQAEERIIPLTLVIENERLVIDSWLGLGNEGQKEGSETKAAVNK